MSNLSPVSSAKLAQGVYLVRNALLLREFLSKSEISKDSANKSVVEGTVGSRLIKSQTQFAICARGAGKYKNDLFLIFRGTDRLADWVTDARMGLKVSSTGSLVHSGFNQTFNSMKSEMAQFIVPLKCCLRNLGACRSKSHYTFT